MYIISSHFLSLANEDTGSVFTHIPVPQLASADSLSPQLRLVSWWALKQVFKKAYPGHGTNVIDLDTHNTNTRGCSWLPSRTD